MKLFQGVGEFFGLDIGTRSIRVVQLSQHIGRGRPFALKAFGYAPVDEQVVMSDSEVNRKKLGDAIMAVLSQSGIKTKNVALGVPSNKTFTTVVDILTQSKSDLNKTIKYQIDQYVPMSIEDAKVDWAILGQSPKDVLKQEVLLTSIANSYVEDRMEFIESLGLNVVAIEPDQISMVRSLHINDAQAGIVVDMGELVTDVAVVYNNSPRLIRSLPIGLSTIVNVVAQNLNVKQDQARQFILKFGLATDKLDGKIYKAMEDSLESLATELNKTLKFFQTRYSGVSVARTIIAGHASSIPMLNSFIANKTNLTTALGSPWINVSMSNDQERILTPIASEFAVAVGLAQRRNNV